MLISGREATALLVATAGVTARQARQALAAGLAGEPERTRAALLYDEPRVTALAGRTPVDQPTMDRACPHGCFVARRAEQLEGPWDFSPWSAALVAARVDQHGGFPFLATVAGFVVAGAEITGLAGAGERQYLFTLGPAGGWFGDFAGRRCPTGPGRPWALYCGQGRRTLTGRGTTVGQSGP